MTASTPLELSEPRQEIEEYHKALIEEVEKLERRLVLQIIDEQREHYLKSVPKYKK